MAIKMMKVFCVMVVCMVVSSSYAEAALTCNDVTKKISPCTSFLEKGGEVPVDCCTGVKGLNDAAKTTPDRQAACNCLKTSFKSSNNFKEENAAVLPSKCGVNIPYKISLETDCNKVK
ncbi:Art an 3.0201 allergen precursor [Artemisia annua]|uniref:Non-specific lipid-transfer protein n=1 Tax=Artemisia annua TaxID=35608 RepID=A0A2U1KBT6_ARTAN|nr:Art an 3.0201 allergen precursor [Artemisia annua]